jgi:small redox-active disulfide protein 2
MKNIKARGTGCTNCKTTFKLIEDVAKEKDVDIQLEKVEQIQDIMAYGVMSTPGMVVDGKVVHAGGVPGRDKIAGWVSHHG